MGGKQRSSSPFGTHDSFSTSKQICELLGDAGIDNLGSFVGHSSHPYRHGETFAETFSALGHWIRHVHVKKTRPVFRMRI